MCSGFPKGSNKQIGTVALTVLGTIELSHPLGKKSLTVIEQFVCVTYKPGKKVGILDAILQMRK